VNRGASQRPEVQEEHKERERDQHRLGHQPERKKNQNGQISLPYRLPDIEHIEQKRQKPEARAEDILPLSHPGNRFHIDRVNGKKSRYTGAPPNGSGHEAKQGKEKDRVDEMKDDIRPMVAAGIGPKQLPVQHMRNPGKRVPVAAAFHVPEGPDQPFHSQPCLNMYIISNINRIIVVDEPVIANRLVADQNHHTQHQGNQNLFRIPGCDAINHHCPSKQPF
jgi:hypothetical protein